MGYTPRTIPETAYEAESDLLRIFKQPQRPPWGLLNDEERKLYAVMLTERFATPEREA